MDGMEITQFTYFQQAGGIDLSPITAEITYGLERIAMFLSKVELRSTTSTGTRRSTYGAGPAPDEVELSKYGFEVADVGARRRSLRPLRAGGAPLPRGRARASRLRGDARLLAPFNILDARGAVSATDRVGSSAACATSPAPARAPTSPRARRPGSRSPSPRRFERGGVDQGPGDGGAVGGMTRTTFFSRSGRRRFRRRRSRRARRDLCAPRRRGARRRGARRRVRRSRSRRRGVSSWSSAAFRSGRRTAPRRSSARRPRPRSTPTASRRRRPRASRGRRRVRSRPRRRRLAARADGGRAAHDPGAGRARSSRRSSRGSSLALSFPKTMRWGAGGRVFVRPVRGLARALRRDRSCRSRSSASRPERATVGHRRPLRRGDPRRGPRRLLPRSSGPRTSSRTARRGASRSSRRRARWPAKSAARSNRTRISPRRSPISSSGRASCAASFAPEFLELPEEITTTAMRMHQKYLPVRGAGGPPAALRRRHGQHGGPARADREGQRVGA